MSDVPGLLTALAPERARALLARFAGRQVGILGDVMLDVFAVGKVNRLSPEAPVPVVEFERELHTPGGAANVACTVASLGAVPQVLGVRGADEHGERLADALRTRGVTTTHLLTDAARRTTTKLRIVTTRNQQVARVDYETRAELSTELQDALCERIDQVGDEVEVWLVSDYCKGTVGRRVMAHLLGSACSHGVMVLVDPKIPHLDLYAGASLVTPNHHEAERATNIEIRTDADACRAAAALRSRLGSDAILITRGEQGMWLASPEAEGAIPAVAREVADVTGAGDTVIGVLALASAAGARLVEAVVLANAAAGVVVGKFGPAPVTLDELRAQL